MTGHADTIGRALRRLLWPLARILVRYGIAYAVFEELAKAAYVDAAERVPPPRGRRSSTARIAVLTGLSRKEVARLRREDRLAESDLVDAALNRAARVVAGWVRDTDFQDADGQPAILSEEGPGGFTALVKRYAGDMPAPTVLDELARTGSIEQAPAGMVRLLQRSYVPSADGSRKLQILGTDTRDLIDTIDHNLASEPTDARFQRKVVYDNIPEEFVGAFRERVQVRGQTFIEEFDRWLVDRDRDRTPGVGGSGRVRLGVGVYLIEDRGETDEAPADTEQQS